MGDKDVRVRVCFLLIGDVDTKSQSFSAEVLIEARWVSTPEEEPFDPKLVVTNLESTVKEKTWENKNVMDLGEGRGKREYHTLSWRLRGVFYENMELKSFPRDIQDLGVRVSSELHASEIQLSVDESRVGTVDPDTFRDGEEWILFNHVETEHVPEESQSEVGRARRVEKGYTAGSVIAMCRVARRTKFFIVNNVMLMFSLVVLSLTCFAFDPGWNTSRISGSMTLLLVAVAFKLSVAGNLPVISYLTYLDAYILGAMLYLCLMTVLFALISPFKEEDYARTIDIGCIIFLMLFIIIFHVIYGIVFFKNTSKKHEEMKRKDQEYEVKIQKLLEKEKAGSKGNSRQGSTKSSAGTNAQKGVALEDVKVDSRPSTAHDVKEEEV
ncbi:uncharacterized protein LOC134848049 [Symsagittifera roscoffensis]|uniref:uncharacterized protein LOC134848049 n=1 Tax=Symsagittifera roscoffensis TaxID=84072 RepID=UPI00307B2C1F